MRKRTIAILAAGVAMCALAAATEAPAFGRGGGHGGGGHGGGGHGGGFHGGGFHGGGFHGGGMHMGGFHGARGGGFHGFAHRGFGGSHHAIAAHSIGAHANSAHAIGAHAVPDGATHGLAAGADRNGHMAHNGIDGASRMSGRQFAHNQFAAANFHGLHDFNRTGFNRNGFGNDRGWNRWGGRFWGAGWNNWGGGWGGWAGPVFWPFLYGDAFSFALWPYGYYDPFWAYGSDFLFASIFAPGPYFGSGYGYGPDYYGYTGSPNVYYGSADDTALASTDREALARTDAAAAQSCNGLAPGVSDLPIERIRHTVHPSDQQSALLDAVDAASSKASRIVKASCPKDIPLTPVARLDAAAQRVDAVIQAVEVVRAPLASFYDSLSDEQKQKFNMMGNSAGAEAGAGSTAPGGNLQALCGQNASGATNLPLQRIEQIVEPNAKQQSALDALKQTSDQAAKDLQASCPSEMPQTPVARLDAVSTRLKAIVAGMKLIRPKLEDFYASLSDEQKAKFNTMGPPPQRASAQPEQQSNRQ